ncbi:MAG TPA: sugar phosphate isomerase/epimerase [Spirochaetia bacterium]|nr:sugar phosphate isomerase/epimerase [Spirochaetia bacterium]
MIRIANAPCSWGVLEFDLEGETAGFEQVLNEIRETGYSGSELGDWGFMPTEPPALHDELDRRGLEMVGAFVPVALRDAAAHKAGIAAGVRTAKLMRDAGYPNAMIVLADDNGTVASRTANAGRITPELSLTSDEWRVFAAGAAEFARTVRGETGLRTVFHHHCAGFVETAAEVEKLLASTPADSLGLVLDMGHYRYGGGFPEAAISLFWDRIWHIHFKDCSAEVAARSRAGQWDYFRAVKEGVFCELGQGSVDFPAIVAELKRRRYDGWIVVEQDVLPGMGSPRDCARRNREYIRGFGL